MSWDDDSYGQEFLKFDEVSNLDVVEPDRDTFVVYCQILYDTLQDITNQWNKSRKRVNVKKIQPKRGPFMECDELEINEYVLDMGARLFRLIRGFATLKTPYLKIIMKKDPRNKFNTQYSVYEYKPDFKKQTKTKTK